MKAFQVTMLYNEGHDSGYYESPLFATRELAEEFAKKVTWRFEEVPIEERKIMWDGGNGVPPSVVEVDEEILHELPAILPPDHYRNITAF
jgi:hypothetical protein